MRIRAGYGADEMEIKGNELHIIADDGKSLFFIDLKKSCIRISTGVVCKHEGMLLDDRLMIEPKGNGVIRVIRPTWRKDSDLEQP